MKRLLFLIHRWSGVVLALLMLLWFVSGLVIVYSSQMTQNRAQQWARAESLLPEAGWLSLGEAWQRSSAGRAELASGKREQTGEISIHEARLVRQAGSPVWLIEDSRGQRIALSANDGDVRKVSPEEAVSIAEQWVIAGGEASVTVRYVETLENPSILRNQEALKPFHRIALAGQAGGELLISERTGEVVHASTRLERGMYWAGNWLHLFRFLDLAGLGEKRVDVLLWLAAGAFVATLTGLIVGWLRWRPGLFGKGTYAEGRVHPYKVSWFRWHFWAGLLGGALVFTWTLSAYLNGNPWQIFSPANPNRAEMASYVGKALPAAMRDWHPEQSAAVSPEVVELAWRHLGGESVLLACQRDGQRFPLAAGVSRFSEASVSKAAQRLVGSFEVADLALQTEYDSYYYPRHGRGLVDRPLPVLRVALADDAGTRVYVDPQDGRLLLRQDQSRRVYRWLWSALHHWDFGWLYLRPVWDVWMLTWIGFGLVLSVTSLVLAWRRLTATFRRNSRPVPKNKTRSQPALVTEGQGS